ncbi:MAG: HTTM domain-containing protein [Candidatus Caenarcaniphilales bacterium]|nr:HTTM domain-containing protein [Candidatus Caenarcaniphilales bacterium]
MLSKALSFAQSNILIEIINAVLKRFREVFTIDLRSLALFRICVGLVFLADLAGRFSNIQAHYSDLGAYPRVQAIDFYRNAWAFSINMISGSASIQTILFMLAGLVGIALVVGYRTRLATFLVWFFTISIQLRNPLVLYGADLLIRNMLFWSLFLPLGKVWSIDARTIKPLDREEKISIFNEATIAILLQLCFMYIFSAFEKTDPVWRKTGEAIHYVMTGFFLSTPFTPYLRTYPEVMKFLSFMTIFLEFLGPFIALCPVFNNFFRLICIFVFSGFHYFSGLFINVGIFPYISIASWFIFLPTSFWDWLIKLSLLREKLIPHLLKLNTLPLIRSSFSSAQNLLIQHQIPHFLSQGGNLIVRLFVISCLVYVFLFNLSNIKYFDSKKIDPLWAYGEGLGINQRWNMFSPGTRIYDGYFIIPATMADGTVIDLFNKGNPVTWTEPQREGLIIDDHRWLKYFERFHGDDKVSEQNRMNYGAYLCRAWNREHEEGQILKTFKVYFAHEPILDNFTHGEQELKLLLTWNCD